MTRVVLVHGFTQTHRSWDVVADALAREHDVVALDAPGHGELSDVALDLWQGARLVAQQGGRAAYVGYSMGGRLCLHVALAHPDFVCDKEYNDTPLPPIDELKSGIGVMVLKKP